ncbi:MAG: phospholipase D family protein, partial [Acetivibrio ethanolgignens]
MKVIRLKRGWLVLLLVVLALLYLIIGAVAPFLRYRKVTELVEIELEKKAAEESCDRAMLLETNTSAWEERIRLFSQAEEEI